MYVREVYKRMFSAIPETIPSSDSTSYNGTLINSTSLSIFPGSTTKLFGRDYGVTITATTGSLLITPVGTSDLVEPTTNNSYFVEESEIVTLRVPYALCVKGNSTTAAFKAAIWSDE